jgi:hypothetical protein
MLSRGAVFRIWMQSICRWTIPRKRVRVVAGGGLKAGADSSLAQVMFVIWKRMLTLTFDVHDDESAYVGLKIAHEDVIDEVRCG